MHRLSVDAEFHSYSRQWIISKPSNGFTHFNNNSVKNERFIIAQLIQDMPAEIDFMIFYSPTKIFDPTSTITLLKYTL